MKIAIIGYSGSGKSTLAKTLARRYGCTALHLDSVHFAAGWEERPTEACLAEVEAVLAQESWVIDGNYQQLYHERRMAEADQIIFLNFPRHICLRRVIGRYRQYKGKSRPDMAAGCEEKIDGEFVWWILWKGRNGEKRRGYQAVAARYPEKFVELCRPQEVEAYLDGKR